MAETPNKSSANVATLLDPDTPFAVVDVSRSRKNSKILRERIAKFGVSLRPHVKTTKSVPLATMMHGGIQGPITVSTIAEAEQFATAGFKDITYAVGIDPHKMPRIVELIRRGISVKVILDTLNQATEVSRFAKRANIRVPALIEVDCDGHRGGVSLQNKDLVSIARILSDSDCFEGVLVHAGESYFEKTSAGKLRAAENERNTAVGAANIIKESGIAVSTVSVGSTPTAHAVEDLTGVTEVRAGNYVFFDLVMAGIGVCSVDDIALSVVTTVIGHQKSKGWIITDAGWMAMSRDRGTANQDIDYGYGAVADLDGSIIPGLLVSSASQEHGIITAREGMSLPDIPIGTRLRIFPNHACATASQYHEYQIIDSNLDNDGKIALIRDSWVRGTGW